MTTGWRRHLRRTRFALTALVASVLIAAAVAVGLVQVLLPLATHYPNFVARQLSARLQRPVKFAAIESEWQPSGPLLTVTDLTLGPDRPGGQSITLPHAALKFDFGAWLRPSHRWITLRVSDAELRVVHTTDGWRVDGFAGAQGQPHVSLQSLPVDLDLRDLRIDIVDYVAGHAWQLLAPRLRVVNVGEAARFRGTLRQRNTRQAAMVVGRVDTVARDYRLYFSTHDIDFVAATQGIDLQGWAVHDGHGSIDLWARWQKGELQSATASYDLRQLDVSAPDGRRASVSSLAGVLRVVRASDGWDLAWRGPGRAAASIDEAGGLVAHVRGHPGAWRVSAAARAVDIAPWLSVLAMAPQAPGWMADWVRTATPRARIDSAAVQWREQGGYAATARLSGLRATATGKIPGFALGRAILRADDGGASLEVPGQPVTLAVTDVFRKPFVFQRLGGTVSAWRSDGHWNLGTSGLEFELGDVTGRGHAHLAFRDGRLPFLSAFATVDHAKVPDADQFWPHKTMSPELVKWLDDALVSGDVTSGSVLVRGDLDDWPFRNNEGRFQAVGTVRNAVFDFSDEWPRATHVDAVADFVDNSMRIEASRVTVEGVTATHAVATIPELDHGTLNLKVSGKGTGPELLAFVRHSPLGTDAAEALTGLTVGGTGRFGIDLTIPLDDARDFSLAGKVDLAKADVKAPKWNVELGGVTGPLLIDGKGFRAQDLAATFRGAPAKLSLAVGSGVRDPADMVEASLDTTASLQSLAQGYPELAGLLAHASGSAPFHAAVRVVEGTNGAPATPILKVQSPLAGIALDFPAPLGKPADTAMPLDLTLQLPPAGAPLTLSLGNVLRVRGRLADATRNLPTALAVHFGDEMPTRLPVAGLVVSGHAARLDLSGWIEQGLAGPAGASFVQLNEAHVGTDDAEVFGTSLGPLQFDFSSGAQADSIRFEGPAIKGEVLYPTSELMTRGISADFERLHWPEPPRPKEAAGPPPPPEPPSATSPITPGAIPPLNVAIADLAVGKTHLGKTSFESRPTVAGMQITHFESKGKDFSIRAQGDWNGSMASSHTHLVLDFTSRDFGEALAAFGLEGLLAGGHDTHVHIDGTWPGPPSSFSLGWMEGTLRLDVGEGRILAVQPGLGRLLGLLSLREIPSRLALHFGDVFKRGFGFDHATADFRFADGSASTSNLLIKAPAAQITMRGRVGFRARDYDLLVTAVPHLGATLPVVGAVVGGPLGAAAGLVAQGLLGKSLNHAAVNVYRVTGSWDKPHVQEIHSSGAPAANPAPASTAGVPAAAPAAAASAPAPAVSLPAPPSGGGVPR